jgi:RoxA-like, cytochrome c-like
MKTLLLPKLLAGALALLLTITIAGYLIFLRPVAQPFTADPARLFNHGSIGNESTRGLPYWIWRVLPQMFPQYLPGRQEGYGSLGLFWEAGEELPVGFSKKTVGVISFVGANCAFCHQSTYRLRADEPSTLVVGGAGGAVDPQGFLRFLMRAGADPRFTGDNFIKEITAIYDMPLWERVLYRFVLVPFTKSALIEQARRNAWMDSRPDWGGGRIDPFNPVKFYNLKLSDDGTIGNSDMMPLWNLAALKEGSGYALHWDGLSTSLEETALAGAIGDGLVSNAYADTKENLARIDDFIRLNQPPPSPFKTTLKAGDPFRVETAQVEAGRIVYRNQCAECHEPTGARYRTVIPAGEIGTDRHRIDMWTAQAADRYNHYEPGYDWKFKAFQKVNGYLANELTGLWLRGPYLHNGSVPNLRELLTSPQQRSSAFYRGYDLVDAKNGGFVSQGAEPERVGWRYETSTPGNGNSGHVYGVDLSDEEKEHLLAYLKTL